jgi:peptidoglycan/xylan/chitin deacetylase (PgdA/CDA1 family)
VIRLASPPDLSTREAYGLDVLVDLSRLLVVLDPVADVVTLQVVERPARSLETCLRDGPALECADGIVRLERAALGYVTDLAGAAVEQALHTADRHGRVPSGDNPLVRAGQERNAPVLRWAGRLRQATREAAGRRPFRQLVPWPDGRRWAAALTHDLDVVAGWPLFTLLRIVELARAGHGRQVSRVARAALGAIGHDPVEAGVHGVLAVEREAGIPATWFLLSGSPTAASWLRGDVTYAPESDTARRIVSRITQAGHEIGLHGSFATGLDATRLGEERQRLAAVIGHAPSGVRQHFLRMRPGRTHAVMEAVGFIYDATFGFSDRNGYRTGVADIVPSWRPDRTGALETVPLVWMDRALSKYRDVEDPAAWVDDALLLAATSRELEGLWVGLWHPNLTAPLGFPGAPDAFRTLVDGLARERPFFGTLAQLVAWRRDRRSARATHVAPDGRIALATRDDARWRVAMEDERGAVART